MKQQPNPADFSANERPREYEVVFDISGTITMTIEADSKEDARQQAEAMIFDEALEWNDVDANDVRVDYIRKTPAMYRVLRDGKSIQTSALRPGDLPRDPDERGF